MVLTVESKDLAQAVKGLRRADPEKTATDSFTESVPAVVKDARSNMARRKGGGTYPRRSGMIVADKSGVRLNVGGAYPWAKGAEFGANSGWVFGRRVPASSMKRRQFAPWSGRTFSLTGQTSYLIGQAVKDRADDMGSDAVEAVGHDYVAALKKAGVPARG